MSHPNSVSNATVAWPFAANAIFYPVKSKNQKIAECVGSETAFGA
jgi:hypothetical protein